MALIKCKECGKEFSSSAKVCPHCGKRLTSRFTIVVGIFFALIFVFIIWASFKGQEAADLTAQAEATRRASLTPEQRTKEKAEQEKEKRLASAAVACLLSLKANLHDPGSAKLDSPYTWYAEERKNGTILVYPTGRAKNAFGAYIKGTWKCVAKNEGKDIVVLSLKQIKP